MTDGSVTGIDRKSYVEPEERVIQELKILKTICSGFKYVKSKSEETSMLRSELEEKYEVPVLPMNVVEMEEEDIEEVMEAVLYDFPLTEIRINLPKWVEGLERNHWIKSSIITTLKQSIIDIGKIRDIEGIIQGFSELEFWKIQVLIM